MGKSEKIRKPRFDDDEEEDLEELYRAKIKKRELKENLRKARREEYEREE